MHINYYKTYIETIKNSIWSDIWRHFYIDYDSWKSVDILRNGSVSCAYFVSNILKQFGMISTSHANVDATKQSMIRDGWTQLNLQHHIWDIPEWAVVFRSAKQWSDVDDIYGKNNSIHKHIWFYIWNQQAISNQSEDFYITWNDIGTPQVHSRDFDWDREIEAIFIYPWDISWVEFIKSDHIHMSKNQQLEIWLISQKEQTLRDEKHWLSDEDIAFGLWWDDMKIGRLCGLSCILMSINYLNWSDLVYKDVIDYRDQDYTFFNPKTWSDETRPVYNIQIGWRNHGWLIKIANDHGLQGEILTLERDKDTVLDHIAQALDNNQVLICSVSLWFDINKTPWWHLVVVRWLDRNGYDYNIIVNDPVDPNHWAPISVPVELFVSCFSGKAIKIFK